MSDVQSAAPAAAPAPVTENSIESGIESGISAPESSSTPQTKAELDTAVQDAIAEGKSKQEIKDMIEEFELKVGGKTKKVKFNRHDDKEVVKRLQLAEAGQIAMQEKAEMEKVINQALGMGKSDLAKFAVEVLGYKPEDIEKFAHDLLTQRMKEMEMSPEQQRIAELERKLQEKEAREKAEAERQNKERLSQLEEKATMEIQQQLSSAFAKHPDLPNSALAREMIYSTMEYAIKELGMHDVTVEDVIPAVKADLKKKFVEHMSNLNADAIEAYLGQPNLDKLRKKRLASAKQMPDLKVSPVVEPKKKVVEEKKKPLSIREIFSKENGF